MQYHKSSQMEQALCPPISRLRGPAGLRARAAAVPALHHQPTQGPYVAARAGVEHMTLRTKGVNSTNATHMHHRSHFYADDSQFYMWSLHRQLHIEWS